MLFRSEAEDDTAQSDQRLMTAADQIGEWLAGMAVERGDGSVCGRRGVLAVTQPVDRGDERSLPHTFDETQVARLRLPRQRQCGKRRVDLQMARRHFFMVTVVPWPSVDWRSNSSIRRLAPGSPAPTPWDVE